MHRCARGTQASSLKRPAGAIAAASVAQPEGRRVPQQPGGRFVWVAHDSSNITEGTGGPQDPSVLMTAEDVLIDLTGEPFEVVRAERVARPVGDATAYDCLVVLEHD